MNRYEEPAPASREDLDLAMATGDPAAISRAMLGILEDGDPIWLTGRLLDLTGHASIEVRATAIICLGHVARIRGEIDRARVLPRLRDLRSDPLLRGRVDDAIDDIDRFTQPESVNLDPTTFVADDQEEQNVRELVDQLEDELQTDGILCLYQFSWFQDVGSRPEDKSEIERTSRAAYDELVRRHPNLQLVWVTWPDVDPLAAEPAPAGTELDFFLDSDGQDDDPLLAIVVPR